jgi:hypothetical protein
MGSLNVDVGEHIRCIINPAVKCFSSVQVISYNDLLLLNYVSKAINSKNTVSKLQRGGLSP